VKPGHVLVVRGMGPKGGPGMAGPASMVVFALYAKDLQNDVAFVSDGQLSGLCNKGLTIAEVSPEAAIGGPLGLVANGDVISIDVDAHSLDLEVAEEELARRRRQLGEPKLKPSTGWLSIYRQQVQPMSKGAVLVRDS
jgi:dihydroxy-acid dehydratase